MADEQRNVAGSEAGGTKPAPPAQSSASGCLGTLIALGIFGVIFVKCIIGGSADSPTGASSSTSTAAGARPSARSASASTAAPSAGSAGASASTALAASPFEKLWTSAVDPDPKDNFDAVLSLYMSRDDFCAAVRRRCGDEFTRDEAWKKVRDEAKTLQASVFREAIPAEKLGLFSSRAGFKIGEFVAARNEFPISVEWPRLLGGKDAAETYGPGRSWCSPRRPSVKRLIAPNGEAANTWEPFSTTELAPRFPDAEAAKAWKQREDIPAVLRVVYKLADAAIDSVKETRAGVTLDSGAGGVVLVQILGLQLREGDRVLAEKHGASK